MMTRRSFLRGLLAAPAAAGLAKLAIVSSIENASRQQAKVIRHCNNYAVGSRNYVFPRRSIPNEFIEKDALFRKYLLEVAQEEGWV